MTSQLECDIIARKYIREYLAKVRKPSKSELRPPKAQNGSGYRFRGPGIGLGYE